MTERLAATLDARRALPSGQRPLAAATVAGLAAAALAIGLDDWRRGALLLVGGALGAVLYVGAFGFTSAFRKLFTRGDVSGVAAQLLMLAAATLLFAPILAQGTAFGQAVGGAVAPVGLQVAIGAFLFGIGMQLGGACGSGCLYTAGGGNSRTLAALVTFCLGAFVGSLHLGWWGTLPSLGSLSLARLVGWEGALPLQLGVLALLFLGLRAWAGPQRLDLRAARPLFVAGLLLAALNWLTLVLAGHPWTITWAFSLWGAKAAAALGWDPATSAFWRGGFQQAALARGVLGDTTSVMNIGILAGALAAALWRGAFRPGLRIPALSLTAALLGGFAMGYGARLAFGCNIGAYFSGIASTSLHGWLWILAALGGNWVGVQLRPRFGLSRD